MRFNVRESLARARRELDASIEALEQDEASNDADSHDLEEVRARLAVLETRVSVIESQQEPR